MAKFHNPIKVAIVGVGNVGTTFAYALLLSGVVSEIVLIDKNFAKAEGEGHGSEPCSPLHPPCQSSDRHL